MTLALFGHSLFGRLMEAAIGAFAVLLLLAFAALVGTAGAADTPRTALVIGNGGYSSGGERGSDAILLAEEGVKSDKGAVVKGGSGSATARGESFPPLAGIYRASGSNPNGSQYEGMTAITVADGVYRFTWWVGKDIFRGTGRTSGSTLVVDWGAASPVTYTLASGGVLNGEWGDGKASETLEPFALAAQGSQPGLVERYRVEGHNPKGSGYNGTLTMTSTSSGYRLRWQVGSQTYEGAGKLEGNLLTVDWGDATPVVYALAADGRLAGLWGGGKGDEVLMPQH